ncbi:MAG: hypothetical protein ACLFPI_07825 [Desulfobacterales bacterium]
MNTPQIILQQLGGNKFLAMTGARNLATTNGNDLSFQLPGKPGFIKQGINHVQIFYNLIMDDYTIIFNRIRRKKGIPQVKEIKALDNIYSSQLQEIFTEETGLYTKL